MHQEIVNWKHVRRIRELEIELCKTEMARDAYDETIRLAELKRQLLNVVRAKQILVLFVLVEIQKHYK